MAEMLGEFPRYGVVMNVQGTVAPEHQKLASQAPHRLHAMKGHPDYHLYWSDRVCEVRVDGLPVLNPIAFDIREGWVDCWEHDGKIGSAIVANGVHRIRGKVTVGFVPPGEP